MRPISFKLIVKKWSQHTGILGLSSFSEFSSLTKLIWLFASIASISYCAILLIENFRDFFDQKTTTNVEKVYLSEHSFPSVTICNLQLFKPSNQTFEFIRKTLSQIGLQFSNLTKPSGFLSREFMSFILKFNQATLAHLYLTKLISENQLFEYGYSINETLVSCLFKDTMCSGADFTRFYSYEYGSCYTFNSSRISKKTLTGTRYGLQLELFTGSKDILGFERGYIMIINDRSANPGVHHGIYLDTGKYTRVGISKNRIQKLSTASKPCRKDFDVLDSDSFFYQQTVKNFNYAQDICREFFIVGQLIPNKCNCLDPRRFTSRILTAFQHQFNLTVCKTQAEFICARDAYAHVDYKKISYEDCPSECSSVYYETSVSKSTFPTQVYSELLKQQSDVISKVGAGIADYGADEFANNFLKVVIYFEHPWYTSVESSLKINGNQLAGIIGGTIGLCMGMSFISFVEIFALIIDLLAHVFTKVFCSKNVEKKVEKATPVK